MFFGLMNAPSTFQCMTNVVTQALFFAPVYIDDDFIFPKSMREHLDHLQEMSWQIHYHGLKIKLSKCEFAQTSVQLLGHLVHEDRIGVDESKIVAVKNSPALTTTTKLHSFPGPAGYYQRFIQGFAEICSVLNASTSGRKPLIWTDGMEEAFQSLKLKLTTPPVLSFSDFDRTFIVETDAFCLSPVPC